MGYHTEFNGSFELNKPLTLEHAHYLQAFNETRRMARRPDSKLLTADPVRIAAGLPIGEDCAYFVGGEGYAGQSRDSSIIDYNNQPAEQPGLWCQWRPNGDGTAIEWDENEKFYNYVEWLEYIIAHFLQPWGYVLGGEVYWQGADNADMGCITVTDNVVTVRRARIDYDDKDYDAVKAERDSYRKELSAVMPSDFKDWWQNSKKEWPALAAMIIKDKRESADRDAQMLEAVVAVHDARLALLQTLWAGSAKVGRWLVAGEESKSNAEGAEWTPFTTEEQAAWLRDGVVPILEQALFEQDANNNPIIPLNILLKHGFDEERHDQTRYPQVHGS